MIIRTFFHRVLYPDIHIGDKQSPEVAGVPDFNDFSPSAEEQIKSNIDETDEEDFDGWNCWQVILRIFDIFISQTTKCLVPCSL